MINLTDEEINLICIYDPGNRAGTIYELRSMMKCLMPDETELKTLTEGVITKLKRMTDAEYDELSRELTPAYSFDTADEDSAYGLAISVVLDDAFPDDDPV